MFVYQLQAVGEDTFGCGRKRTICNTVLFSTVEGAQKRIEKFKLVCMEKIVDPKVTVVPLEVID